MLRKLAIISALLFTFCSFSQWRLEAGLNFLRDTTIDSLHLDANEDQIEIFAQNAYHFRRLRVLTISNAKGLFDYKFLKDIPNLYSICFRSCQNLPIRDVISYLSKQENLYSLHIVDSYIPYLPRSIFDLKKLRVLEITDIDDVHTLQKFIFKSRNYLDSMIFPNVSISEMDPRIRGPVFRKYNRVRYLELNGDEDKSENYFRLPLQISTLALNTKNTSTYLGVNPLFTTRANKIRYLHIDWNLGNYFYFDLYPWISGFSMDNRYAPSGNSRCYCCLDSFELEYKSDTLFSLHGSFQTGVNSVKVYSDAYLRYGEFLKQVNQKLDARGQFSYDTSRISSRFDKLYYSGENYMRYLYKDRSANSPQNKWSHHKLLKEEQQVLYFRVMRQQGTDAQMAFNSSIKYEKYRRIFQTFPELTSFANRSWTVKRRDAKKMMSRRYYDIRILYDEEGDRLSMVLKHIKGFDSIPFAIVNMGMDSIREPNRILYRTYLERLDQRLRRSQARIDRKVQSALRDTAGYWSIFKESLSLAEREMSKQEWMNYREQILRNEREFLKNSNLSWPLFRRFLLLSDFTELDPFSWRRSYCRIEMVADSFPNQLGQRRPVRKIHILDLNKKTLTSFNALQEGMLGALNNYNESVFYLPTPCPATIRIILESPNGTLSYIPVAQSSIESRLGIDYPAGLVDMNLLLEKIYPEIL